MNDALASITHRVRDFIARSSQAAMPTSGMETEFDLLARDIYSLQRDSVPVYDQFCARRGAGKKLDHWSEIPALPISAFKQAAVTNLAVDERAHMFCSSGTTAEERSRHYHDTFSLRLYETSVLAGFQFHVKPVPPNARWVSLTPPPSLARNSSLVHMIDVLHRNLGHAHARFLGTLDGSGSWHIDMDSATSVLADCAAASVPVFLAGTAFNFVHLLDHLEATAQQLALPPGTRVMETGGYKGRSRVLSRSELYRKIHDLLGVAPSNILSEYGMCELSSQAYDHVETSPRAFRFPPWARARIVSPEDGRVLPEGEMGLLQVFDLANVRSVIALQTEDLAISTPDGFEISGRLPHANPRGCSLMTA